MALRDVVDNCGDGSRAANPVLRLIDSFTGEKAAFQEKWLAQRTRPEFDPRQMHHRPEQQRTTLDDFQSFEESEMAREFDMMSLQHRGDPRAQARQMRPMMHEMGMKGMPHEMAAYMESMMRPGAHHAPGADMSAWEAAYADASGPQSEAEMFEMFDRAYGRPAPRPGHPMSHPGAPRALEGPQRQRPNWSEEFEQENKFAEFDAIYQGGKSGGASELPATWMSEFEEEYPDAVSGVNRESRDGAEVFDAVVAKENQELAGHIASEIASRGDPRFQNSELLKMMTALSNGELAFQGDKVAPLPADLKAAVDRASAVPARDQWASEFEMEQQPGGVWQREFEDAYGPQASSAPPAVGQTVDGMPPVSAATQADLDEFDRKFGGTWAKEFEQVMREAPLGEGAYDDPDEAAYEGVDNSGGFDFEETSLQREYSFVAGENAFDGDAQAYERGQALFKAGRLTEAVEAFEAAVKQKPNHSQAWQLLGATHAENDRDDLASLALLKAIQTDPDNRDALITLAVSYTNDFHKNRALECLQDWLSTAPEYQAIDTNVQLGPNFDRNHQLITNLFIQAARTRPADPDADVQIALGLLYNLTFEYDRAIDCFKAAAMKRPDDYLVWNKLGATQANAKQSEEAIDAFIRALEIKPSYTRACSNLGISFMSLNEYGEAAKAFLSALALNPNALHQWDNLRHVFSLMKRQDLLKKCDTQDISLFQDEFHF